MLRLHKRCKQLGAGLVSRARPIARGKQVDLGGGLGQEPPIPGHPDNELSRAAGIDQGEGRGIQHHIQVVESRLARRQFHAALGHRGHGQVAAHHHGRHQDRAWFPALVIEHHPFEDAGLRVRSGVIDGSAMRNLHQNDPPPNGRPEPGAWSPAAKD